MSDTPEARRKSAGRFHALRLVGVVLAMFAFGFALVPLYDVICDITGLNGRSATSFAAREGVEAVSIDTSRTVTVEFLTTVNSSKEWDFEPKVSRMTLHPGEFVTATFFASNREGQAKVAQAIPSVLPWNATRYVHKTACFCFERQPFDANERREMPVVFTVDPDLPADVDTVIMSYTLFELTDTAKAD
jgi:cytochrome c oxidase assembly protein subunit 11